MLVRDTVFPVRPVTNKLNAIAPSSVPFRFWFILLVLVSSAACLAQSAPQAQKDNQVQKDNKDNDNKDNEDSSGFLYAIENPGTASSIETFQIDRNTGALTPVLARVAAGNNANDIVVDRKSKFLFVGTSRFCCRNGQPPAVMSFGIDISGALTLASQINLPNDNDTLNGLALDRTGRDLYASSMLVLSRGNVSSLLADRASGNLSVLAPDPLNTLMPGRLVMHPNGRFVYAAVLARHHTADAGGFDLYLRDPHTGMLTYAGKQFPGGPFFHYYGDSGMAAHGRFLVAISQDFNNLATVFSVNAATGALTIASQLSGAFRGMVADRRGRFVVLTDANGGVTSYALNKDGSLTPAGVATAAANVSNVVVDDSNHFVYVENSSTAQIFAYTFDEETGALGPVPGSPFTTAGSPIRMAIADPKSENKHEIQGREGDDK